MRPFVSKWWPAENLKAPGQGTDKTAKSLVVGHLEEEIWPSACLDVESRFGQLHTRLGPLLGKIVNTPHGPGRLIQVFASRVAVVLDSSPKRVTHFFWDAVLPPAPDQQREEIQ